MHPEMCSSIILWIIRLAQYICRINAEERTNDMRHHRIRRYMALLLAAVMLLSATPAVFADEAPQGTAYPVEGGNIYVAGNTVTGADETVTSVDIPPEDSDMEVIAIGHDAFAGCKNLSTVYFPKALRLICSGSFAGCTSLKSLYFTGNAPNMEMETEFQDGCDDLTIYYVAGTDGWTSPTWNDYRTEIWEGPAPDPQNIPYAVEGGNLYFNSLTGMITGADDTITGAEIPEQIRGFAVTGIAQGAFQDCYWLSSVVFPATLVTFEEPNFERCYTMKEILVAQNNPSFSSINGILYNKAQTKLIYVPAAMEGDFVIPDSVTALSQYAFKGTHVASITVPAQLTHLPQGAFRSCFSLMNVFVDEENPQYKSIDGFFCDKSGKLLSIPSAKSGTVKLPEGITALGTESVNSPNAEVLWIPSTVTKVERDAVYACDILKQICFVGDAPEDFAPGAFAGASSWVAVFYREGTKGWSKPTWQGYPSEMWTEYPEDPWFCPFYDVRPGQWYYRGVAFGV